MNSSDEMIDAVQDIRLQLTNKLDQEHFTLPAFNDLKARIAAMDSAIMRLEILRFGGLDDSDWSDQLAGRTEKLRLRARQLHAINDENGLNKLASEVVSILDFVIAHVEPDKPWPRK